jgi:two-component system LytT family response regulator
MLHVGARTHMLRRTLADLNTLLAPHGFQRIHRSALVNLGRVGAVAMRADGEYDVVLASSQHLRMSRRYRKTLLERLEPGSAMPAKIGHNDSPSQQEPS